MNIVRDKITIKVNRKAVKRLKEYENDLRARGYKPRAVSIGRLVEALALIKKEEALRYLEEKIVV